MRKYFLPGVFILALLVAGLFLIQANRSDQAAQLARLNTKGFDAEAPTPPASGTVAGEGQAAAAGPPVSDSELPHPAENPPEGPGASVEHSLLSHGMVNESVHEVLKSKDFDKFMTALQAGGSAESAERATGYRIELEDSLGERAPFGSFDRFVCGKTFCAGSMRIEGTEQTFQDWIDSVQESTTLPMPTLSSGSVRQANGVVEGRFVFTTSGTAAFYDSGRRRK